MKIAIVGERRGEGKTKLINHLRHSLLSFGGRVEIWDGGGERPSEVLNKNGTPVIEILVTNDKNEAADFVREKEN